RRGGPHPQSLRTQPRTPNFGGFKELDDPSAVSPRKAHTRNSPASSVVVNEYVIRQPSRGNSTGTVPVNSRELPSTSAVPCNASPRVPYTLMTMAFVFGRADQTTYVPTVARTTTTRRAVSRIQRMDIRRSPILFRNLYQVAVICSPERRTVRSPVRGTSTGG